jgi:DNA-binding response OmpR family regulator
VDKLKALCNLTKDLDVLYVEDDLSLQEKTFSMLKNIFNHVGVASNGEEALTEYDKYYNENEKYFDIVITDIKMPFLDGAKLSRRIKEINKDQIIVITSAHDESKYLIEFINMGIKKFIKKPFNIDVIISMFLDICTEYFYNDELLTINLTQGYSWNKKEKKLFRDSQEVKLSYTEVVILDLMLNNQNQIFSNSDFYYTIQTHTFNQELSNDSIKSAIKRLRKKIPDDTIENIYGQGYRIKKIEQ